jgi:hypothetical protein
MKSRLVSLLAAVLLVAVAIAEPPMPPPGPPGLDINRLAILLDLDSTQKAAVQQVLADQQKTISAQREQEMASGVRPTREEMKAKHDAIRQELRAKLQPILNANQLSKFDALTEPLTPLTDPPMMRKTAP